MGYDIWKIASQNEHVKYCVYQLEQAPSTNQLHLQGFIHFNSPRKFDYVKNLIGGEAHVEIAQDVKASIAYCQKSDTRVSGPWKFGSEPIHQGKRSDLVSMYEDIKNRRPLKEMIEENPSYLKYEKAIRFACNILSKDLSKREKVDVYVHYGKPGTGKTYSVYQKYGYDNVYKLACPNQKGSNLWFDNYNSEKVLLIDDFDKYVCELSYIKNILDHYPQQVQCKGGFYWACWDTVIITSNTAPATWYYGETEDNQNALRRRIMSTSNNIDKADRIKHYVEYRTWIFEKWDLTTIGDHQQDTDDQFVAPPPPPRSETPPPPLTPTPASSQDPNLVTPTQQYPDSEEDDPIISTSPRRSPPHKRLRRTLSRPIVMSGRLYIDDEAEESDS